MPYAAARTVTRDRDSGRYQRHRPEQTLLYRIIAKYYPVFTAHLAEQGRELPGYVQREFDDYLKCGRLEHGFLRVRCDTCHAEHLVAFSCKRRGFCASCGARRMAESAALLVDEVLPAQPMRQWVLSFPFPLRFLFASRPEIMGRVLGTVYRVIATHLIKKAGLAHQMAKTGAVTLIQRFGSALNLNVHFHMLFLDGVYVDHPNATARFRWVKAPTTQELTQLAHTIAQCVGRLLERQGLLERDAENSYLASDAVDDDSMNDLLGHSITYRIAVGPQAGRKVFTLQTLPACDPEDQFSDTVASNMRAGTACRVLPLPLKLRQYQSHSGRGLKNPRSVRFASAESSNRRRVGRTARRGALRNADRLVVSPDLADPIDRFTATPGEGAAIAFGSG